MAIQQEPGAPTGILNAGAQEKSPPPGILNTESQGAIPEDPVKTDEFSDELSNPNAELSQEQTAQIEAYTDNATILIYSPKSQPAILQELQASQNPIESVATTANHLHKILKDGLEKTGEQMTDQTMFLGATHLVSELVVLADAANLYVLDEKQRLDAFQLTMMQYFQKGLEDGTIDPVELQKELDPLLTDEQRQIGLAAIDQTGVSKTQPPKGATFRGTPPQQQPQAQPAPSAEIPPGILGGR